MNRINWTHLLTLTLSPEKGSNELKTNGALNEALPMGIYCYDRGGLYGEPYHGLGDLGHL